MPISEQQLQAYRKADYVVFADRKVVVRVGEPSAELDGLLRTEGATTAAFVTAANPRGEQRSDTENGVATCHICGYTRRVH